MLGCGGGGVVGCVHAEVCFAGHGGVAVRASDLDLCVAVDGLLGQLHAEAGEALVVSDHVVGVQFEHGVAEGDDVEALSEGPAVLVAVESCEDDVFVHVFHVQDKLSEVGEELDLVHGDDLGVLEVGSVDEFHEPGDKDAGLHLLGVGPDALRLEVHLPAAVELVVDDQDAFLDELQAPDAAQELGALAGKHAAEDEVDPCHHGVCSV